MEDSNWKKVNIKCKVYVKNPFERKLTKGMPKKSFNFSKIIENASEISENGHE
jgi:hypothetical protein